MVNVEDLKIEAKRILAEGKVKYVIGYGKKNSSLSAPIFIKTPEDADRLIWDPSCVHNLTRYLLDEKRRKEREKEPDERPVGIVVKGCDSRAINVLLQEKYINREHVYILGVSCEKAGVINEKKLREYLRGKNADHIEFDGEDTFTVTTETGNIKIKTEEVLAERCLECRANYPVIYDVLLGDKIKRDPENPFKSLEEIESWANEKRWAFWNEWLNKCIRCYACRSVCPMCYCDECVVDTINFAVTAETTAEEKAQKIKWIDKSTVSSENFVYHITRALHLAGRCIDCGECERACPLDIPLRHLNKKLEKDTKELFDYDVGFDASKPSLISSFREEDPEDFIR